MGLQTTSFRGLHFATPKRLAILGQRGKIYQLSDSPKAHLNIFMSLRWSLRILFNLAAIAGWILFVGLYMYWIKF